MGKIKRSTLKLQEGVLQGLSGSNEIVKVNKGGTITIVAKGIHVKRPNQYSNT